MKLNLKYKLTFKSINIYAWPRSRKINNMKATALEKYANCWLWSVKYKRSAAWKLISRNITASKEFFENPTSVKYRQDDSHRIYVHKSSLHLSITIAKPYKSSLESRRQ